MNEDVNLSEATKEIKNANEDELRSVIEQWCEYVRTKGMQIGASYISAAIYAAIEKHIMKAEEPSLRSYKRCMDDILKIISVQLTRQNDSEQQEEQA
jgi:hypothetical protein